MIINTKGRWFGVLTEWVLYTGGRRWGSWVCSSQAVHGNGGLLKCNTKKVTSFSRERETDRQRGERESLKYALVIYLKTDVLKSF